MIILILIFAFIVRLIALNQSLWLDEGISVLAAQNNSLVALVTKFSINDFHPPLHYILLWEWGRVFGFSEISMRMPSVLLGLATIYITYLIGKRVSNNKVALLAALLLSINPLFLYYNQEARMYTLAAFAVSLQMYAFLHFLGRKPKAALLVVVSTILVLLSDYVCYLVFPVYFIYLLLNNKKLLKQWLLITLGSIALFSPWIIIFVQQYQSSKEVTAVIPQWKQVLGTLTVKSFLLIWVKFVIGRISFVTPYVYALAVIIPSLIIGVSFLNVIRNQFKKYQLIISWFVLPLLLAVGISFVIPLINYFRFLFLVPAFVLLIAVGLGSLKRFQFILIALFIMTQMFFSEIYLFNPSFHREDWKGLVGFLSQQQKIVLLETNGSFAPFDFYNHNKVLSIGALDVFPASSLNDVSQLHDKIGNNDQLLLVDYLGDISDPQRMTQKKLVQLGFKKGQVYDFRGVGFVYSYSK